MELRIIDDKTLEEFVSNSNMQSFYQSEEWKHFKENEEKEVLSVGLFSNDSLVGVSLVTIIPFMKIFKYAYASRGFVYDYSDITGFRDAIFSFFKNKKVAFVRIDPLVVLNSYNCEMEKTEFGDGQRVIDELVGNGFKHFGFNMAYETNQFRFIHRINVMGSWEEQCMSFNKSTRKNIEMAEFRGVNIRSTNDIDEVMKFLKDTSERKGFRELSKNFYNNLIDCFKDNVKLDIAYIDKKIYISNLKSKLKELNSNLNDVNKEMTRENVGQKLRDKKDLINKQIEKYNKEIGLAQNMNDVTDIGAMVSIEKYKEIVAFASGMDNNYRMFNPKYVMYPGIIKRAIEEKMEYVNFLGVKNIFDKKDADYGIYEIKKGFGGETLEYIGEFDLPINNALYKLYKLRERN